MEKLILHLYKNEIQINVLKHFSPSAEKIEVKESKPFRKPKYAMKIINLFLMMKKPSCLVLACY